MSHLKYLSILMKINKEHRLCKVPYLNALLNRHCQKSLTDFRVARCLGFFEYILYKRLGVF